MRRGLIIFIAVMALLFSVVLCACEDANLKSSMTLTTHDNGIIVEVDGISSNTSAELERITDEQDVHAILENDLPEFGYQLLYYYEMTLYVNGEEFTPSDSITATIPLKEIRTISSYDKCRFFIIDNDDKLEPLAYTMDEKTIKFTTKPFKCLVFDFGSALESDFVQHNDGKAHILQLYKECPPSFQSCGHKTYYVCRHCGKYYDSEFNEISAIKDLIIPQLSGNILLYVNGEKKGEFTKIVSEDLEWSLSGINLKKDDVITLVDGENPAISHTIVPETKSNLMEDGKVHNDVNGATIKITAYHSTSELNVMISGFAYPLYFRTPDINVLVEADENGDFEINNVKLRGDSLNSFWFLQDRDGQYSPFECTIGDSTDQALVLGTRISRIFLQKNGIYNISYNVNTSVVNVELVSYTPTSLDNGKIVYKYLANDSMESHKLEYNNSLYPYSYIWNNFYAVDGRNTFTLLNSAQEEVNDLTIAKDSENYINFATEGSQVQFIEEGTYKIIVNDFTHEVRVEKIGDATPDMRITIHTVAIDYVPDEQYVMELNQTNNIYEKKGVVCYSGEYVYIFNEKDSASRFKKLKERSDRAYVYDYNKNLMLIKGGEYNFYFDNSTGEVDVEFVRELTASEKDIPGSIEYHKIEEDGSHCVYQYDLTANPNNSDEVQILNVVVPNDHLSDCLDYNYICVVSKTRNACMRDLKMERTDYAGVINGALHYAYLSFSVSGIYNIYVNIYTYEMRVVKVA